MFVYYIKLFALIHEMEIHRVGLGLCHWAIYALNKCNFYGSLLSRKEVGQTSDVPGALPHDFNIASFYIFTITPYHLSIFSCMNVMPYQWLLKQVGLAPSLNDAIRDLVWLSVPRTQCVVSSFCCCKLAVTAAGTTLRSWEKRRREEEWNHSCPINQKSKFCSEHPEQMSSNVLLTGTGSCRQPSREAGKWEQDCHVVNYDAPPGILLAKKKKGVNIKGQLFGSDRNPVFAVHTEKSRLR